MKSPKNLFVISGFIMFITTVPSGMDARAFMRRRIIRVVPLYWMLTIAMVLVWLAAPGFFKTLVVTPGTLVESLLFIPHFSKAFPDEIFPLLVPGWTLNYEMFFYALFAIALLLSKRFAAALLCTGMVLLVCIGVVAGPFKAAPWISYTSPLLLEFVAGMLIGQWWMQHPAGMRSGTGMLLFAAGWLILFVNGGNEAGGAPFGSQYFTIAAAALVVAGSLHTRLLAFKSRSLKVLGDATYAIYLTHVFSLGVIRYLWMRVFGSDGGQVNAIAFAGVAMSASLLVGVVVYFCIERPLGRYLSGLRNLRLHQR